jgi:hypothetical protein
MRCCAAHRKSLIFIVRDKYVLIEIRLYKGLLSALSFKHTLNYNTIPMKKTISKITAAVFVAAGLTIQSGCGPDKTSVALTTNGFPQDVLQSCTVTPTEFSTWFTGGTISENGHVMPANSVTFPHQNNCDFYKWSQQMFLWITSPVTSGTYTNGNTVMESATFYTVTPEDANEQRLLIPHKPGTKLRVSSHITQNGPNNLPMILDKQGRLFEVEKGETGEKPMLKNAAGKTVEVDHVAVNANGGVAFFDKTGKQIPKPRAILRSDVNSDRVVREFKAGDKSVYLDKNGNVIDTEVGQATGDGLIAQNGSMVYYITMVNDMYAYYLTGGKAGLIDTSEFPTTEGDRDSILAYAATQGWPTPTDPDALAIEIKTSWVEAVNLPNLNTYLTVDAIIPEYNKSNPAQWIPTGERTAKLALIGMHVVGSVAGHPEMSWATFEHQKNAPNASYSYIDSLNNVVTVPADSGTGWLLTTNANATPVNLSHIKVHGDTLDADTANTTTISASNTLMEKPFGVAPDQAPNAENATPAASNSEVISSNNNIFNMLMGNDIRKNYFLVGATWTSGGHGPNGVAYPANGASLHDAIGTSQLANSTMETYFQFGNLYNANGSCFRCHSGDSTLWPSDISHVFSGIQPLPTLQKK